MISPPQTRHRTRQPIRPRQSQLMILQIQNMMTSRPLLHHQLFRVDRLVALWTLCIRRLSCVDTVFISRALA